MIFPGMYDTGFHGLKTRLVCVFSQSPVQSKLHSCNNTTESKTPHTRGFSWKRELAGLFWFLLPNVVH